MKEKEAAGLDTRGMLTCHAIVALEHLAALPCCLGVGTCLKMHPFQIVDLLPPLHEKVGHNCNVKIDVAGVVMCGLWLSCDSQLL